MNNDLNEPNKLINDLLKESNNNSCKVMIAPSFVSLQTSVAMLSESNIEVVSQTMHHENNGAYTGEVSAKMLSIVPLMNSDLIRPMNDLVKKYGNAKVKS